MATNYNDLEKGQRIHKGLEKRRFIHISKAASWHCEHCLYTCQDSNKCQDAFQKLQVPCDGIESEMNHLYPAFAQPGQECFLQKEPLLFSCAGSSTKYPRLCPCRDFREGQVALCQDCLGG
ncbi:hypothetical protein JEQ12_008303 [Ovis aries]|uniref:alpha-1,6-mannosyl-glycoprotein 6-beta-N-acetylglucosaminyltransferase n=1 Tax=Ovis aries TaxID=9940 RepID=A0A836CU17_SHEEP|nr:hypothetical protein JEQ12_008303 [Ovis aries]